MDSYKGIPVLDPFISDYFETAFNNEQIEHSLFVKSVLNATEWKPPCSIMFFFLSRLSSSSQRMIASEHVTYNCAWASAQRSTTASSLSLLECPLMAYMIMTKERNSNKCFFGPIKCNLRDISYQLTWNRCWSDSRGKEDLRKVRKKICTLMCDQIYVHESCIELIPTTFFGRQLTSLKREVTRTFLRWSRRDSAKGMWYLFFPTLGILNWVSSQCASWRNDACIKTGRLTWSKAKPRNY